MIEKVTAVSNGMYTEGKSGKHTIRIDEPESMGGADHGANPLATLLVALAGCENVVAHFVAKEIQFDLRGIEFEIEGSIDPRGMMGDPSVRTQFQRVTVHAKVTTSETDERIQELQRLVDVRCPISTTLTAAGVTLIANWTKA